MKLFIYAVISVVAISVIAGFFIVGSPKEERLRDIDERRVGNLQFLQSELINYWINKGKLPDKLSDLRDDIRGVAIPMDPETGVEYGYNIKNPESFSLCAVFVRPSLGFDDQYAKSIPVKAPSIHPGEYYGADNWAHGEGNVCFERTIDKEIYIPRKEVLKQ